MSRNIATHFYLFLDGIEIKNMEQTNCYDEEKRINK